MTVKSNLYAKYYFELRALFKENEKEFPLDPLDRKDAMMLELNSNKYRNELEAKNKDTKGITTGSVSAGKKEWVC